MTPPKALGAAAAEVEKAVAVAPPAASIGGNKGVNVVG
jgi:hypothetical protein